MKKTLLTILAAVALFALAIGFTACGNGGNGTANGGNKFDEISTTEEVYGFSAATAGALISSMNGGSAQALAQAKGLTVRAQNTVTDEETIASLNEYMMLVESLLSDGAFGMTEGESDLPEYEKKAEVTYKDILGNTLSYTMYYNETLRPDYDDDDDDDFDETEEEYSIEGILVVDGQQYAMRGERETESEGNESESETNFWVTLSETRSMRVEQSFETEGNESEQEYTYSILEGRQLIERSAFEYEQEGRETEIKLSLTKDGQTQIFYFEKETERGEEYIRIRVGDRNGSQSYRVSIETDADGNSHYVYEYAGKRTQMDRFDRDDD